MRIGVLFVCTGNICRSPTAEGVFRSQVHAAGLAERMAIDSAGTHDYHIGEPPDPRSQAHALRRGFDLSDLRARQLAPADFDRFRYLLAMDRGHVGLMRRMAPKHRQERIRLMLEFAPGGGAGDVPDPYYGGPAGFERVLDLIEAASAGLLAEIRRAHFDNADVLS
ncbi:MAG: low molecular weight phosphotyrosine protein phosphatase [Alphaproteobacteria bacterium]|nr:low molecular weight phosphotyrosine protein phosphatase [Alphaproteobacteria bacterium]